jgi:hypothetical protein
MLCRTASMEKQIRQREIRQRELDQAKRQKHRAKIERLQKKYSKWHEVYEYDENDMVGYVSGTRIQLWYGPKPIGLIITPDNTVRQWTLCEKPWDHEYEFSVPFASEDELEIRNRDGVTMCRFRKEDEQDDTEDERDDTEDERDDVDKDEEGECEICEVRVPVGQEKYRDYGCLQMMFCKKCYDAEN